MPACHLLAGFRTTLRALIAHPSAESLSLLIGICPDVTAISYFDHKLILELDELPLADFVALTMAYPAFVDECAVYALNGPVQHSPKFLQRNAVPDATVPEHDVRDATAYPRIHPGVMLTGFRNGQECCTNAGVTVVRDGEVRLTVAEHGIGREDNDNRVWHPDPAGTIIGKVTEWFDETDLGLVSLFEGIELDNDNFGTDAEFLLPSRKLMDGDIVTVDSFVSQDVECTLSAIVCSSLLITSTHLLFKLHDVVNHSLIHRDSSMADHKVTTKTLGFWTLKPRNHATTAQTPPQFPSNKPPTTTTTQKNDRIKKS